MLYFIRPQHFQCKQILEPEKTPKKRLIPIGKKKVPGPKERFFGFVQAVSEKMEDLTGGMGEESHETATSGTRTTQAARIAAEGESQSWIFQTVIFTSHEAPDNSQDIIVGAFKQEW